MPEVSVILPNYNHEAFLQQRIDSILNQTFKDFELIILDDCSSDNSKEIIDSYCGHPMVSHIVYNEVNSGSVFRQWQRGIKLAKGRYTWIAESDDLAVPEFLERLVTIFVSNPSIAMVYSQSYDMDEQGNKLDSRLYWTEDFEENLWEESFCISGKTFLTYLYKKNVIPNVSACLIKREYLVIVFDKQKEILNFRMCGDWFGWLLIADYKDVFIAFVKEPLNYFRIHPQSTRNHYSKEQQRKRLLEEAKIFNSGKFEIEMQTLKEKNTMLIEKWIKLFAGQPFSFALFQLCKESRVSRLRLLWAYLTNKLEQKN